MATLSNNAAGAFQDIREAIVNKLEALSRAGKVWGRVRYADNLEQWLELAAIDDGAGLDELRVSFVYLNSFTTERSEARQNRVSAVFTIEIIQGFYDGDDNSNSSLTFESFIGDIWDAFKDSESLGFTDQAGQAVENDPISVQTADNEGRPSYVDGVLSHRIVLNLPLAFRLCI